MPRVTVELKDFAPDLPDTVPGYILPNSSVAPAAGAVPFVNGWGAIPGFVSVGASALDAASQGAAVLITTGGSARVIAGTATKLYEIAGQTLTDVSRGGGYTTNTNRWSFAVYGDFVYATNKVDAVQKSTGAAFSNQLTIPKCNFVDRVLDFLVIAGTNESTNGDQADRWWCSALGNPDDFTPSIATQSATNRLTDVGGPITASKALGDNWVIYKQQALYMGTYIGPPDIWSHALISGVVGTWGQGCVCKVGFSHFFFGFDDFYVFDGTIPRPIPNRLKTWVLNRLDKDNAYKINSFYDRYEGIVFWLYPSTGGSGALDSIVAYNLKTQQWGHVDLGTLGAAVAVLSLEALVEYVSGGMTYDEFYPPTGSTTWNSIPAIPFDSPFFSGNETVFAAINASHVLGTLTTDSSLHQFSIRSSFIGDDEIYTTLRRAIARMVSSSALTQYVFTHYIKDNSGDSETAPEGANVSVPRCDLYESSRWHSVGLLQPVSNMALPRIVGFDFTLAEDGEQ